MITKMNRSYLLLQCKSVTVKDLLQPFVGEVDAQLLERVTLEDLKAYCVRARRVACFKKLFQ